MTSMDWLTSVAGAHASAPVLIADVATWKRWRGNEEQDAFDAFEGEVGTVTVACGTFVPCEPDGGVYELGVGQDEVVVLQRYDSERDQAPLRAALAAREHEEFLGGELDVVHGIVIGNAEVKGADLSLDPLPTTPASVGPLAFFVPLAPGRYLVLEGRNEDADLSWYRLVRGEASSFAPRFDAPLHDEMKQIMARVSFADERSEVRALADARRLVTLGRADLAMELCARSTPAGAVLADHVRVFAFADFEPTEAILLAISLASRWLQREKADVRVDQTLGRIQILEALEAVPASAEVVALRAQVKAAPDR